VGLVRTFRPGTFKSAADILHCHLPHLAPSVTQEDAAREAVAHATGCVDVASATDPTLYTRLTASDPYDDNADAHVKLLSDVYPVMARVRTRNRARVAQCGLPAVIGEIVRELATLFSVRVAGVPTVYTALRGERERRIAAMKDTAVTGDQTLMLARRMFWRQPHPGRTLWGSLMASLIGGICTAARLLPPQRKLWLLLFLRSHKCVANHTGSSAYIICCGPPETGKSMACAYWLSCMAIALQRMNDGESAKAHTAMDPDADMRACFQDELQEHVSGDNGGDNAKQTLISNGVLKTKRLTKTEDGEFVLQETVTVNRSMRVTCTNNINDVKDAIKSRATIVAVPALKASGHNSSASMLASIVRSDANALRDGFSVFCRALTTMQGDFWALEAAGTLAVDDRMLLLFKLVSDTLAPRLGLSARKMVEIRHMACSIMVLDLGSQWHRLGKGAAAGQCPAAHALWLAENAVIRMEHVIAAVGVSTASTAVDMELAAVQRTLRSLVRIDAMGNPVLSADQSGYVLATTRRRLAEDVADANVALGPGLTKALLRAIHQGATDNRPNVRYDTEERQDLVILDRNYMLSYMNEHDNALLDILRPLAAQATASWVGNYLVFKSAVRHLLTDTGPEGARKSVPAAINMTESSMRIALSLMGSRTVVDGKKPVPLWRLEDTCAVARPTAHTSKSAVRWRDGSLVLKKVEQSVLLVHASVFRDTSGDRIGPMQQVFARCLAVAGGYEGVDVVVGIGADSTGLSTVRADASMPPLTVRNPMWINTTAVEMLMGKDEGPTDALFPRDKEFLTLGPKSQCEACCFASRMVP